MTVETALRLVSSLLMLVPLAVVWWKWRKG